MVEDRKQTNRQTEITTLHKDKIKNFVYTFLINRNGSVFTAGATVCYARHIYIYNTEY